MNPVVSCAFKQSLVSRKPKSLEVADESDSGRGRWHTIRKCLGASRLEQAKRDLKPTMNPGNIGLNDEYGTTSCSWSLRKFYSHCMIITPF